MLIGLLYISFHQVLLRTEEVVVAISVWEEK